MFASISASRLSLMVSCMLPFLAQLMLPMCLSISQMIMRPAQWTMLSILRYSELFHHDFHWTSHQRHHFGLFRLLARSSFRLIFCSPSIHLRQLLNSLLFTALYLLFLHSIYFLF